MKIESSQAVFDCEDLRKHIFKFLNKSYIIEIGKYYGLQITPSKYIKLWQKRSCLYNGHTLIIDKPYGVVIKCKECEYIQSFNWLY